MVEPITIFIISATTLITIISGTIATGYLIKNSCNKNQCNHCIDSECVAIIMQQFD